ncbi:hypothetical protein DFH09DRAFT_1220511 [Mycena vulgaris]|nr:hypothetical protein DFH09DRAFT_1220511 [Mycena vulgaris]
MPPRSKIVAPKAKAPRKSRAKAKDSSPSPPPTHQVVDESSDIEITSGKQPRTVVNWIQNPSWTEALITYLCEHPEFRIKLFSDSTAEAKQQGRPKLVGKDGRPQQYTVLAAYIFKEDEKEQVRYASNPPKYATAVETRLRRLKREYKVHVGVLGATGAGLLPDQVTEGSNIASLLDAIRAKWPWWDDLHPFWRELPNYNPVGVQSSGTDHASDAQSLFQSSAANSDDEDEEDGRSATSRARDDKNDDEGDHESDADEDELENEEDDDHRKSPARQQRSSSINLLPTPPPTRRSPSSAVKKTAQNTKVKGALGGRDLGLAKANGSASKSVTASKSKEPLTAIDRMNDLRETESRRMSRSREMQHEEEMARIKVKKIKYDLKTLQAQNERKRLNSRALTSPSSSRQTRVLNLSPRSPARMSQASRRFDNAHIPYAAASPAPPSFLSDAAQSGFSGDGSAGGMDISWMGSTRTSASADNAGVDMSWMDNLASGSGSNSWPVLPHFDGDPSSFSDGRLGGF